MDILSIGLSGLTASRMRALTTANNLANINTPGYQAQRADSISLPGGNGVAIGGVSVSNAPGRLIPTGDTVELSAEALATNNVDIAREAVNLLEEEHAFKANAAVIRTGDEMTKTMIDLIG